MQRFYLKNKDTIIAILGTTQNYNRPFFIIQFDNSRVYWQRYSFFSCDERLNQWIEARHSPLGRKNVDTLYKETGIDSLYKYVMVSKCLSLNDTFWIVEEHSKLKWRDVSPYTNSFSRTLTNIAWGTIGIDGRGFSTESPELSTGGMSVKCWQRFDGEIYMLKTGGQFGELEFSNAYSEYFASQLAKFMGLHSFVDYDLRKKGDQIACAGKLFTSEFAGYFPICALFDERYCGDIDDDIRLFKSLSNINSERIIMLYKEMLLLDSLTFNVDRHTANYGFMVDNDSLKIITLAPIYDNDNSLFNRIGLLRRDISSITEDIKMMQPRTYGSHTFIEQARRCMNQELFDKTRNVSKNFEFKNHPKFPVNKDRLKRMSALVRWQANSIVNACIKH